jgi:hypothetical protein
MQGLRAEYKGNIPDRQPFGSNTMVPRGSKALSNPKKTVMKGP